MKKVTVVALTLVLASGFLHGQESVAPSGGGSYLIVRSTDHAKDLSFKVMNQNEYRALCSEIAAESRCWEKAMNASEKEWKANPETAKKTFPRNAIAPKKAVISQTFSSQEKAAEKVAAFEKLEAERAELNQQRLDEKEERKSGGQKKPPALVKAEQAKQQLEDKRNQQMKDALGLFEAKLAQCMAGQVVGSSAPAADPSPAKSSGKTKK